MGRPNWDEYFMNIAAATAARSTCPRLSVGAVIVQNKRIIATGYNGSVSGHKHCISDGCLMHEGHCIRPIHAEVNAILQLAKFGASGTKDSFIYVTHSPCINCFKEICQAGINFIIYKEAYRLIDYKTILDIPDNEMPTIRQL